MGVIMITGAAKRIGGHIAMHVAKKGFDVALHYHSSYKEVQELLNSLEKKYPHQRFQTFKADLRDESECTDLIETVQAYFTNIDVLINNASIFQHDSLATCEADIFYKHMHIHALAPLFLSRVFAQQTTPHRHIINIIDAGIFQTHDHYLSYSLSKNCLWTLTQNLAMNLAPHVRVNAIAPSLVLNDPHHTEAQFQQLCDQLPIPAATPMSDFEAAIDFLCNTQSVTGQILYIDGGKHLQK